MLLEGTCNAFLLKVNVSFFEGIRMILRKDSELHLVLFIEKGKRLCHSLTFHFMVD